MWPFEAKLLLGLNRRAELFHVCGFDRDFHKLKRKVHESRAESLKTLLNYKKLQICNLTTTELDREKNLRTKHVQVIFYTVHQCSFQSNLVSRFIHKLKKKKKIRSIL